MQEFGILELTLPLGENAPDNPEARLVVENQSLIGHKPGDGTMRFRFCPKAAHVFHFTIRSNVPALDGKTAAITAYTPEPDVALQPSSRHQNWWTDDPDRDVAEYAHTYTVMGAKTVNQWREEFLKDFAERMDRCKDG